MKLVFSFLFAWAGILSTFLFFPAHSSLLGQGFLPHSYSSPLPLLVGTGISSTYSRFPARFSLLRRGFLLHFHASPPTSSCRDGDFLLIFALPRHHLVLRRGFSPHFYFSPSPPRIETGISFSFLLFPATTSCRDGDFYYIFTFPTQHPHNTEKAWATNLAHASFYFALLAAIFTLLQRFAIIFLVSSLYWNTSSFSLSILGMYALIPS